MSKYTVDLSLLYSSNYIGNETKERIFENLLIENKVRFSKYYSASNNREVKSEHGKYIDSKYKITVYEFQCDEPLYNFIVYMFNKVVKQISSLNSNWN